MVYDLRNHGWNRVGVQQNHNFPILMHDHDLVLESIDRRYGEKPTVGVFHSVSALISLLSFTKRFSARILFDPPLCKPTANEAEFDAAAERQARSGQAARAPVPDPGGVRGVPGLHAGASSASCRGCASSWRAPPFANPRTGRISSFDVRASTRRSSAST